VLAICNARRCADDQCIIFSLPRTILVVKDNHQPEFYSFCVPNHHRMFALET